MHSKIVDRAICIVQCKQCIVQYKYVNSAICILQCAYCNMYSALCTSSAPFNKCSCTLHLECTLTDQFEEPARRTSYTDQLVRSARRLSQTDQLDRSARHISQTDQFFIFEALASSHIQRLTFQLVQYIVTVSESDEGLDGLVLHQNPKVGFTQSSI